MKSRNREILIEDGLAILDFQMTDYQFSRLALEPFETAAEPRQVFRAFRG